jgi:hypothetical protein
VDAVGAVGDPDPGPAEPEDVAVVEPARGGDGVAVAVQPARPARRLDEQVPAVAGDVGLGGSRSPVGQVDVGAVAADRDRQRLGGDAARPVAVLDQDALAQTPSSQRTVSGPAPPPGDTSSS